MLSCCSSTITIPSRLRCAAISFTERNALKSFATWLVLAA
jgi:hypothetical protein